MPGRSAPDKEGVDILSSMQSRFVSFAFLGVSAAALALGATGHLRFDGDMAASQASFLPGAAQAGFAPGSSAAIASDIARWNSLRQSDNQPFAAFAAFLIAHRGWPGEAAMRRAAERQIDPATVSPGEVLRYFAVHPPLTAGGRAHHALALLAAGELDRARQEAREAWYSGVMAQAVETRLLSSFSQVFTQADHDRRLDTLLDNGDRVSAGRVLALASAGRRPLYEARIALQTRAPDAATKLGAVAGGSADPGLVMDRANWLRASGQSQASRELLAQPLSFARRPRDAEKFMETQLTLARAAAADGQWTLAYRIASQAGASLDPGTDVSTRSMGERDDFTSLTWLAGTAALKHLGRPTDAERMFEAYAHGGRSLQVLTKGRYWAGRAAQAAGRSAEANAHYEIAARYPELFYAQLALDRLRRPIPAPAVNVAVQPTPDERLAFQQRSLVAATRYLGQAGSWSDQSLFVRTLSEQIDSERDRQLAIELSRQIGRPDLAVWVARSARNGGTAHYVRAAYPEGNVPEAQRPNWSFAHGIMRQESSFDRAAVSHAGARGMMQLMPGTAREVAGRLGLPYELGRLTSDPDYNISLGSSYLATLLNQWSGNAVLAAASYNAGAGNVRRWIAANGDPRMPGVDVLQWIEDIPFSETRGYVQRVIENAVVYDAMHPQRARSPELHRTSWYLGRPNGV